MATAPFNPSQLINFTRPDLAGQNLAIQRQQALAQQLMEQGSQQQDPAQLANPGGFVVPVSPLAGLAKALEKGAGGYMQGQADQKQLALYKALQQPPQPSSDQIMGAATNAAIGQETPAGADAPVQGPAQAQAVGDNTQRIAQALQGQPQGGGSNSPMTDPSYLANSMFMGPDKAADLWLAFHKPTDQQLNMRDPGLAPYIQAKMNAEGSVKTPEGTYAPAPSVVPPASPGPAAAQAAPVIPGIQASDLPSNMNPMLPNLVNTESGGNPNAVSPKGAGGLPQIMPGTARDPGFGVAPLQGWDGKNPATAPVKEQLRFGNDYINAMQDHNGGNPRLAAAAYNAGPGRVDGALRKLPAETQGYVPKVVGNQHAPNASDAKPLLPSLDQIPAPDTSGMPKYNTPNTTSGLADHNAFRDADVKSDAEITSNLSSLKEEQFRLNELSNIYKNFQSGGVTALSPEIMNKLVASGIISDPATIKSVADAQAATETHLMQTLKQIKDTNATMGGAPTRTFSPEVAEMLDKGANVKMQPEALWNTLGQAKGIVDYHTDMASGWNQIGGLGNRAAGGYTLRPTDYVRQFTQAHDVGDYKNAAQKNFGPFKGMSGNTGTSSASRPPLASFMK